MPGATGPQGSYKTLVELAASSQPVIRKNLVLELEQLCLLVLMLPCQALQLQPEPPVLFANGLQVSICVDCLVIQGGSIGLNCS